MTVDEAASGCARPRGISHVALASAVVAAVGAALTIAAWRATSDESARLIDARQQADADTVLSAVDAFVSGVDQVLVESRLAAVADELDPSEFIGRSQSAIAANPLITGFALHDDGGEEAIASTGSMSLLEVGALRPSSAPVLVGFARDDAGFRFGFSQGGPGTAWVYVEVLVPPPSRGADAPGFAVASSDGPGEIILANSSVGDALVGPVESLSLAGTAAELYIEPVAAPGLLGVPAPSLVLAVGLAITAATTSIFAVAYRRRIAIATLRTENAALDDALARQRALELELRAAEHRWAAVLRDSPDTVAFFDRHDSSLELLNRSSFLGHGQADLSAPEGMWRLLDPEDRRRMAWIGAVSSTAYRTGDVDEATVLLHGADGHSRWFNLRVTASEAPNDATPTRLMITFTDVHHRWERQRDRAQLQTSLQVSERMQAVNQRAAGLSHDLRNLLAVIGSSTELLERRIDDPQMREDLRPILSAVDKGRRLSKQIMAMAKQQEPELIDLNDVVTGIETVLGRALGDESELRVSLDPQACPVIADRSHVEQVLMNLAVNARDAMPRGGIVTIGTRILREENGAGRCSPTVMLSVSDTGTGIAEDDLDRIFEPYFTTKPRDEGTGLGLAMIKEIVDSMDGSIAVRSTVGTGTEFEISIPLTDPSTPPTDRRPAGGLEVDGPLGLVVDQDPAIRTKLGAALDGFGLGAVVAESTSAVVRIADELDPDFVLLAHRPDRTAPASDVVDALRRAHPDLTIVWVCERGSDPPPTGHGTGFVWEPMRKEELMEALRVANSTLVAG